MKNSKEKYLSLKYKTRGIPKFEKEFFMQLLLSIKHTIEYNNFTIQYTSVLIPTNKLMKSKKTPLVQRIIIPLAFSKFVVVIISSTPVVNAVLTVEKNINQQ